MAHLGQSWALCRGPWVHVGPGWAHLGPRLGLRWPMLGLCWPYVGLCGPHVGPVLALCWPYVGLCWPRVALLGAYVGAMLAISEAEAISVERPPRCQIFPSRTAPWNQKPRKNNGFLLSPTKKRDRPRPRNTVNNGVFVTAHAKLQGRWLFGGRSAAASASVYPGAGPEASPCPCRRPSVVTEGHRQQQ